MLIETIQPGDNIQSFLDLLNTGGGGILNLNPTDTYFVNNDLNLYSNVTINGSGSVIDFGGGAYGLKAIGTNSYFTGTISVNFGSTIVTGLGTVWTINMIGQEILIGDYFYLVDNVTSHTSLTLDTTYIGLNISGASYVIADTIDNISIVDLTLINSSSILLDFQYVDGFIKDGIFITNGLQGIRGQNSANVQLLNSNVDNCTTGISYKNVPYCTLTNWAVTNISGGTGFDLNGVTNTSIGINALQNITGVGIKFTNCSNLGMINYSIIQCTSHGIEFVSGNADMDVGSGYINSCEGDGLKLTATSNRIEIATTDSLNNTGFGFNIANANCSRNIFTGNNTFNNTAGALNDSGTSTLKSSTVNNFI